MRGSRDRSLIVKAYCRGIFNYTDFDPLDMKQVLREAFVLNEIESELVANVITLRTNLYSAGQGTTLTNDVEGKVAQEAYKVGVKELQKLIDVTLPWTKVKHKVDKSRTIKEAEQLMALWESKFGKVDSPENQKLFASIKEGRVNQPSRQDVVKGVNGEFIQY